MPPAAAAQLDLLAWTPPETVARFEDRVVRASTIAGQISGILRGWYRDRPVRFEHRPPLRHQPCPPWRGDASAGKRGADRFRLGAGMLRNAPDRRLSGR